MTNDFFAPIDSVTKTDRDAAERRLREAHALGRIDAAEFEARMGQVITAERLDELAAATDAPLPPVASSPFSAGSYRVYSEPSHREPGLSEPSDREPTYAGTVLPAARADQSTTMAVIAHLSPFLTWLIGPAVIWAISAQGSYAKREAAKAFNWQLIAFVVGLVVGALGGLLPGDGNPLARIWTVLWIVVTVIGAVKAAKGADWRNPIRALVPLEVLPERKR